MNKAAFPFPLIVECLSPWEIAELEESKQLYRLVKDFVFVSKEHGDIVIPSGFVCDTASVPSFSKAVIDNDSPCILFASWIHDWLYNCQGLCGGRNLSRLECDEILREAMDAAGASELIQVIVFDAVRLGGQAVWDS